MVGRVLPRHHRPWPPVQQVVIRSKMDASTHKEALDLIRAAGLEISESEYSPKTFGSWYIAVQTKPRRRLIWDGKEQWYTVEEETAERFNGRSVWRPLWTQRSPARRDLDTGIKYLTKKPV